MKIIIIISLSLLTCLKAINSPIVIIPGLAGNQLEAKIDKKNTVNWMCKKNQDWFRIWFSLTEFLPLIVDCWIDNIKLIYDQYNQSFSNNDGVEIRVKNFGSTESMEYIDPSIKYSSSNYFFTFVDYFTQNGYQRDKDIFGAPYDFRLGPTSDKEFHQKLKQLIENAYNQNNQSKVTIVSHSMGGLWTNYFLNQQDQKWKDIYVKQWIMIAAPLGGTSYEMKVMISGTNFGINWIRPQKFLPFEISIESDFWLLPNPQIWGDQQIIRSKLKSYSAFQIVDLLKDLQIPNGEQIYNRVSSLQTNLSPPNVDTYSIYGTQIITPQSYVYDEGFDNDPTEYQGDGDGTVNIQSLQASQIWKTQQDHFYLQKEFPGITHSQIIKDKKPLDYIMSLLI